MKDTRSRKWQVTINNPLEKGYTHDRIKEILSKYKSCIYWCMSDTPNFCYMLQNAYKPCKYKEIFVTSIMLQDTRELLQNEGYTDK